MKRVKRLPKRTLICAECYRNEGDPKLLKRCPYSDTGEHRMVSYQRWRAVIEMEWFDVHSKAHARHLFAESCISSSDIVSVEQVPNVPGDRRARNER
jgi:hypothetical protein